MRSVKSRSMFLPFTILICAAVAAAYYFSRPTVVGYIGPFSGMNMMEGQDFFRGLNAGFQNDSFFNRFEILSMDINHSRREAVENVKHFLSQDKIQLLWTDFPKAREKDFSETLQGFAGEAYSVSQFAPSEGELSVTIGDLLSKQLKSSKLQVYYSQPYKKLLEVLKLNFRSQGVPMEITETEIEFIGNEKKIPVGTDTVLVLANTRQGVQAIDFVKAKSFGGRIAMLNIDQYVDFAADVQKRYQDLYAITIFDQEVVKRLKAHLANADVTASTYAGFSIADSVSKRKELPTEKAHVFVMKVSAEQN